MIKLLSVPKIDSGTGKVFVFGRMGKDRVQGISFDTIANHTGLGLGACTLPQ